MRHYWTGVPVSKATVCAYIQELQDTNPGFEIQLIMELDAQTMLVFYTKTV